MSKFLTPMFKVLHLSDIHMGSGYIHGRLNPETGLNTRFEDFVQKINCMGLNHLIFQKPKPYQCSKSKTDLKPTENATNWWYLN